MNEPKTQGEQTPENVNAETKEEKKPVATISKQMIEKFAETKDDQARFEQEFIFLSWRDVELYRKAEYEAGELKTSLGDKMPDFEHGKFEVLEQVKGDKGLRVVKMLALYAMQYITVQKRRRELIALIEGAKKRRQKLIDKVYRVNRLNKKMSYKFNFKDGNIFEDGPASEYQPGGKPLTTEPNKV